MRRDAASLDLEVESLEIELLLQGLRRLHPFDFEEGAEDWGARVREAVQREGVRTISGLQEKLLHDHRALERFAGRPREEARAGFLRAFRREIVPVLKTYPFIRIWQVGCGAVFDIYALAIILLEEGVYDKTTLYNTDVDEGALKQAQHGLFAMNATGRYEREYNSSGGNGKLADYLISGEETGMFDTSLKRHMVFAQHDFATDGSLNEFNAIFCRRPLGTLDRPTRWRAETTLLESLVLFGILGLAPGERPETGRAGTHFESLDRVHNLYRRIC